MEPAAVPDVETKWLRIAPQPWHVIPPFEEPRKALSTLEVLRWFRDHGILLTLRALRWYVSIGLIPRPIREGVINRYKPEMVDELFWGRVLQLFYGRTVEELLRLQELGISHRSVVCVIDRLERALQASVRYRVQHAHAAGLTEDMAKRHLFPRAFYSRAAVREEFFSLVHSGIDPRRLSLVLWLRVRDRR